MANSSDLAAISADGRFVAFNSNASDLVASDTNNALDVFVHDLQSATTTPASINSTGSGTGNGHSFLSGITPDGRFVAFDSQADGLVPNDTNGSTDAFVRDMQQATTILISVNRFGTNGGNGFSRGISHAISEDGRFVAFQSTANDLVTNDTNGTTSDVFVRDLQMGITTLVSVNGMGTASGNGSSDAAVISADGRFVAFTSSARDLVTTDTNSASDVFVRDLEARTTRLVSINWEGTDSGRDRSLDASISADGRIVAFTSWAGDLVPTDTNRESDVFVRDMETKTTTLVSINWAGTDSVFVFTGSPLISASRGRLSGDGHFVTFQSAADLVPVTLPGGVFVRPVP